MSIINKKNIVIFISLVIIVMTNNFKANAQTTVCQGDSVYFSVNSYMGVIQWQVSADLNTWSNIPGATNGTLGIAASSNAYFRAKITDGTCQPDYSDTSHILVSPQPAQPTIITGSATVCKNQTGVVYAVAAVSGVTYTWTYFGTGFNIVNGQGTHEITVNVSANAASGTLTCTPSNACGSGLAQTLAITVNGAPNQPSNITGTATVCQGVTGMAYSVTNIAGVTYNWTYTGTGFSVGSGQNTNSIAANFSTTATQGTLTCTPSNTCGNGPASTMAISINTLSVAPTSVTYSTTSGNRTYTAIGGTVGTGGAYNWYTSSCGGTHTGTGNPITKPRPAATVTVYVRIEGTCNTTNCASVSSTLATLNIQNEDNNVFYGTNEHNCTPQFSQNIVSSILAQTFNNTNKYLPLSPILPTNSKLYKDLPLFISNAELGKENYLPLDLENKNNIMAVFIPKSKTPCP